MRHPELNPGDVMVHLPTLGIAVLADRKHDDSGWWIVGGGGLADSVIRTDAWTSLEELVARAAVTDAVILRYAITVDAEWGSARNPLRPNDLDTGSNLDGWDEYLAEFTEELMDKITKGED